MNLIRKIYEAMTTDDLGDDKQSEILNNEYLNTTEDQQKAVDRVFIALCGGSLKTIIEEPKATTAYNPYRQCSFYETSLEMAIQGCVRVG
jgi:hypothetical protein